MDEEMKEKIYEYARSKMVILLNEKNRALEQDIKVLNGKIELWTTAFVIVGVIVGWRSSDKYLLLLIALVFGVAWAIDCLRKMRRRAKYAKKNMTKPK